MIFWACVKGRNILMIDLDRRDGTRGKAHKSLWKRYSQLCLTVNMLPLFACLNAGMHA